MQIREKLGSKSKEIIVAHDIELPLDGITLTIPQRGDKKNCWNSLK